MRWGRLILSPCRMVRRSLRLPTRKLAYGLTLFFFVLYCVYAFYDLSSFHHELCRPSVPVETRKRKASNPAQAPEPKTSWHIPQNLTKIENVTILMWTTFYGGEDMVRHIQKDSPIPDWCTVTFDKSQLSYSKAIVFHVVRGEYAPKLFPPRDPSQMWVFYLLEAPANIEMVPAEVNGVFNRTMSYR